jgi:hypothetical protein
MIDLIFIFRPEIGLIVSVIIFQRRRLLRSYTSNDVLTILDYVRSRPIKPEFDGCGAPVPGSDLPGGLRNAVSPVTSERNLAERNLEGVLPHSPIRWAIGGLRLDRQGFPGIYIGMSFDGLEPFRAGRLDRRG